MKLLAASDLMFGSRIRQAAEPAGIEVAFEPRDGDILGRARELQPAAVLLDLTVLPDAPELIRSLKRELVSLRVLAYVGHTQVDLAEAARAAGADEVFSKGELTRLLPELLRSLAAQPG
ncbi:MAG: hypothetical protein ACYDCL_13930 [Myxococcales bacterium]